MRAAAEALLGKDIASAATALRAKTVSSQALTEAALARSHDVQRRWNAFTVVDDGGATSAARQCDERETKLSPLDGVPVCVKDAFCTMGLPTSAGSQMLRGWQSGYDATSVKRLKKAGAVLVGKNNLDEFCMGSSNVHSVWGPAINPLCEGLSPGGSSGGTAVAVASGAAFAGLGTDTGGSVRQPAAMCGVVGFKPSYGAISRYGVVAMSSSLDTVSIVARTVADARIVFEAIRGPDGLDSTADEVGHGVASDVTADSRVRIGVSNDFFPHELSDAMVNEWKRAALALGWDGDTTLPMPHTRAAMPAYYTISSAEASSNLARYDGVRFGHRAAHDSMASLFTNSRSEGFGDEATRRILMGTFVLSRDGFEAFFAQAQKVRRLVSVDFERAFERCDVLVVPTVPSGPRRIADIANASDPVEEWIGDLFTVSASLAGLPAISVPVATGSDGMPISMQVIGPRFHDLRVLDVAERLARLCPVKQ
jgi:aspartyl-tRNA(Asn)/glutamyl-tRNA(Gln) amidotransferase subunit A